jgi:prepilin-type N-terminal cleavage/methylation domain-containing protein
MINISVSKKIKGFTFTELVIVIAIVAMLSVLVMNSVQEGKKRSRDLKQLSDMSVIQSALQQFKNRCGAYPWGGERLKIIGQYQTDCIGDPAAGIVLKTFLPVIPTPPVQSGVTDFYYNSWGRTYILHTKMESSGTMSSSMTEADRESFRYADLDSSLPQHCYDPNLYPLDYCLGSI